MQSGGTLQTAMQPVQLPVAAQHQTPDLVAPLYIVDDVEENMYTFQTRGSAHAQTKHPLHKLLQPCSVDKVLEVTQQACGTLRMFCITYNIQQVFLPLCSAPTCRQDMVQLLRPMTSGSKR